MMGYKIMDVPQESLKREKNVLGGQTLGQKFSEISKLALRRPNF